MEKTNISSCIYSIVIQVFIKFYFFVHFIYLIKQVSSRQFMNIYILFSIQEFAVDIYEQVTFVLADCNIIELFQYIFQDLKLN